MDDHPPFHAISNITTSKTANKQNMRRIIWHFYHELPYALHIDYIQPVMVFLRNQYFDKYSVRWLLNRFD